MWHTTLMPFQPDQMSPGQLAAVSSLARYSGHTDAVYAHQLRGWFRWCETNGLDPLPAATSTDTASTSSPCRRSLRRGSGSGLLSAMLG